MEDEPQEEHRPRCPLIVTIVVWLWLVLFFFGWLNWMAMQRQLNSIADAPGASERWGRVVEPSGTPPPPPSP